MLRKRGEVWVADLRADGGPRLSLKTTDRDTARVLHVELEQLALKGQPVTNEVVRALLASREALNRPVPGTPQPVQEQRPSAGITLRQAFELAMVNRDDWRGAKAPESIRKNYGHVAKHFGPERLLGSITSRDTEAYRSALIEAGKSASTVNQRLSILSVLFDVATVQHAVTGEPKYAVIKPLLRRAKLGKPRFRVLTDEEEVTVIEWFRINGQPLMADLTGFLLDTGFRLSEALAVQPKVTTSVHWGAREVWARDTKSGHDRCVPMTQRVHDILSRNPDGFRLDKFSAAHRWADMRASIGLADDAEFVIHALRHTCCTRMVRAGWNAFQVMHWMGHRNVTTTQQYVTLFGQNLKPMLSAHECAKGGPMAIPAEAQEYTEKPAKSRGLVPQGE